MAHIAYESSRHTAEALSVQLTELLDGEPNAFIVGSLARAVYHAQSGHDPTSEYVIRGEHPLIAYGQARDIDMIIDHEPKVKTDPFLLDTDAFNNTHANLTQTNGEWWLSAEAHGFAEPIHSAVMEPQYGETIYGIRVRTVPLQTMEALHQLRGVPRRKETLSANLLAENTADLPRPIQNDLYAPFKQLHELNVQSASHLRTFYRRHTPIGFDKRFGDTIVRYGNVLGRIGMRE